MVPAVTGRELTFTAWGRPIPFGNFSVIAGRVVERTKGSARWKRTVITAAREAKTTAILDGSPWPSRGLDDSVAVTIRAYFPRPAGHYGTGRNADELKPSAPRFPITTSQGDTAVGDIDKIPRAILDALTQAAVIADDARIVRLAVEELYALQPQGARAVVTVREYDPPLDVEPGALPIELSR
jgi:Holliday junction resolvase RusA-like endonuclease